VPWLRGLTTQLQERLPNEADLDSLWARTRSVVSSCATRSAAYLQWRYELGANGRYQFASCWRGPELVGLAVMQNPERLDDPRLAGLVIGSVVDLILDPSCPGAVSSLLVAARRWARSRNHDALLLTMSQRGLRVPLLRAGYISMPGNIHLIVRDPGDKHGLSPNLDEWLLTRGDSWSDHL